MSWVKKASKLSNNDFDSIIIVAFDVWNQIKWFHVQELDLK
jgi:hypothetical protein